MLLRVSTENSRPTLVKPSIGRITNAQLASTSPAAPPGDRTLPESPTSGCEPTAATPARRLLSASRTTISTEYVAAASSFPAKSSARLRERVSTVFHVPYRSSEAKRSPATIPLRIGKPNEPRKPSMKSGTAKPEPCTQRPKSVSAGTPFWPSVV